jgi:diguanylate cyclase (GGDEF)-like protein
MSKMPAAKVPTAPMQAPRTPAGGTPSLVLLRGGRLGRLHPLLGDVSIGREDSNTIVLELSSVSRHHARIFRSGDALHIQDSGSRNGTYLNDREISEETPLGNGDIIQIGDAIFKFLESGNVESQYHEEIYKLTIIDPLTQLHNKRYLVEFLAREISRSARHSRPLSLVIMDLDHFKAINDEYGHVAGDHVLRSLGRRVASELRQEELAARYGGEEFVFVLPETALPEARRFAERMRELVEQQVLLFDGKEIRATASFGVAALAGACRPEELIEAADRLLYDAKEAGRNRVISSGE